MIDEVLLDREILSQLDRYEVDWDEDVPDLDTEWAVEELSHETLALLS